MNEQEKTREELIIELGALQKKYDSLKEISTADFCKTKDVHNEIIENENIPFQKFIEHAPTAMAIVNMNGVIEFINHKAVSVFGYQDHDIPTMERWFAQAYPNEEYRNEVIADWMGRIEKALLEKIEIVGNEYRVTCKDKTVKTVFIWGVLVSEKVFVLFEDITKRKNDEADLKEAKEKAEKTKILLNNITDNIPAYIAVVDINTLHYKFVNLKFKEGFNKESEDIIGSHISEIIGKSNTEFAMKYINEVRQGRESSYINTFDLTEGKRFAKVNYVPGYNVKGELVDIVVLTYDITEIKQFENELKKAKEKAEEREQTYRLLVNSIPNISILLFDKDSRYLIADGAELEKVGFDLSLIQGKTLQEAFPKQVVDTFEPLYLKALRGESSAFEMCYGGFTYFHQVRPVYNAEKEIFAGIVIAQNITDKVQAQKAIIESQRMNAIGEMASSIAHDFNNSLQAMMGNIEVAKLETKLPETALQYFNSIASIISDVSVRVKSLQRFGDTKRDSKDNKLVNLNAIIKESILQLNPLWKDNMQKRGLTISIKVDYGDIPEIYCNEGELKNSFHNIIKNSIEAMPEGGIINIITRKEDNGVFVTIEDTGIGMDEEGKLKIFQPFFTTKGFDIGRGLGMSGVYSIMRAYGGDIFVKNTELGKGTTIALVFPLHVQEVRKEEKGTEENVLKKEVVALRVLWVEDEALIRLNFRRMVESLGHKCDIANGGKSALEYLNKSTYDIVITDIGMPEMNGWQLADIIKEKFGSKIKVVVVSGWDIEEQEKIEHDIKWGLGKPFQINELEKLFEEMQS